MNYKIERDLNIAIGCHFGNFIVLEVFYGTGIQQIRKRRIKKQKTYVFG